jgi:AraC family transcriptional regulator
MNPVGKALWFIESHYARDLTLEDVAAHACVSRFHLARAFEAGTGYPVMRYVRARRLSDAARLIANGAPDILAVAVDAGYGSHEAFTRAFREQFGLTPDALRKRGFIDHIALTEPITMDEQLLPHLDPPRLENLGALLVAGLSARYTHETSAGIPAQWQKFTGYIGQVPGQVGRSAYGVCYNGDDTGSIDYLCGVEVSDFSMLPDELSRLRIAPQRYAVFNHDDHVSTIRRTWNTIWNRWLPASGFTAVDAPSFELYGERFDPATGMGGFEIWLPVGG